MTCCEHHLAAEQIKTITQLNCKKKKIKIRMDGFWFSKVYFVDFVDFFKKVLNLHGSIQSCIFI